METIKKYFDPRKELNNLSIEIYKAIGGSNSSSSISERELESQIHCIFTKFRNLSLAEQTYYSRQLNLEGLNDHKNLSNLTVFAYAIASRLQKANHKVVVFKQCLPC